MVAECRMNSCHKGDSLVQCSCCIRQESALAGTRHTNGLAIPLGQRGNIVNSTNATNHHTLVVARLHTKVPVTVQGAVHQIVIKSLRLSHIYPMNTYFEHDSLARSRISITTIGTHTGTRHTQQGGILARFGGNAQYAIGTRAPADVLKRDLIDIHLFVGTLWQQLALRIEHCPAGLLQSFRPELVEILRFNCCRFQLFRRKSSRTGSFILFVAHMCSYGQPIKPRFVHFCLPGHRAILQEHALFFHFRIHLRASLVVDSDIV